MGSLIGWEFFNSKYATQFQHIQTTTEAKGYLNSLCEENPTDFYTFCGYLGSFYKNIKHLPVKYLLAYHVTYVNGVQTITKSTIQSVYEGYQRTGDIFFT